VDTYHRGSVRGKESRLGRKHTHYSTEFRAEAVRLAETSGQSIRSVAMDLGISNESLRRWIALAHERPAGTPLDDDERAELEALRRRVKVLETEKEILRKAAAFFASETERTR
jgi:transposase